MDWRTFQESARCAMSTELGVELLERKILNFPKKFDMVSADLQLVGDAKFFSLVNGKKTPPAKLMEIAGHVWLLEKVPATRRFLVFGNQKEVPDLWLRKIGSCSRVACSSISYMKRAAYNCSIMIPPPLLADHCCHSERSEESLFCIHFSRHVCDAAPNFPQAIPFSTAPQTS